MTGDRMIDGVAYLMMLALPLSALAARGLGRRRSLRLATLWALIIVVVALTATLAGTRLPTRYLHNADYRE